MIIIIRSLPLWSVDIIMYHSHIYAVRENKRLSKEPEKKRKKAKHYGDELWVSGGVNRSKSIRAAVGAFYCLAFFGRTFLLYWLCFSLFSSCVWISFSCSLSHSGPRFFFPKMDFHTPLFTAWNALVAVEYFSFTSLPSSPYHSESRTIQFSLMNNTLLERCCFWEKTSKRASAEWTTW